MSSKKGEARSRITLQCTECRAENYRTSKNKQNTPERLELKKLCKNEKKITLHREKR